MVIAEFQVGLALKGFASKLTVPNYRVKWGADFGPQKWMFCPKASAKHAQVWIFLGSNSLLGIHLSQQQKKFKIFYHLQSLREAFIESICPKIGGLTVEHCVKEYENACTLYLQRYSPSWGWDLLILTAWPGARCSWQSRCSGQLLGPSWHSRVCQSATCSQTCKFRPRWQAWPRPIKCHKWI